MPEVVGIPRSVDEKILKEKVIQVFEKASCNIDSSNIEACHRITKKKDRVIVKFSRRKDCQRVLSVKKNLQKLKMEDIGLTGDVVSNGTVKVKISEIGAPISTTHADDFTKYFPDIDLSLSAQSG